MSFNPKLKVGQIINNNEIADIFKCSNQGGMRRAHATNTLVIISDHTKLYDDHWEDDIFHYTGMGKKGDQSLTFAQNKTLAESNTNKVDVFLFEVKKSREYTFAGQMELSGSPYQGEQLDEDRQLRKVWIFPLKVVKQSLIVIEEIDTLIEKLDSNVDVLDTEKESIIKARIGQSSFKSALLYEEKKCKLCGVTDSRFLIASHIKPWSQSNNYERLDKNNGLLLCPNHDALFDKGYISFKEDGSILISTSLDQASKVFLNINETMNIELNPDQQKYISWHRENLFKVEKPAL
ncbi:HNH endonuclease [Peribacillus frigoritolerans]|uniref:HNH endonuclease n=1 Tax=Peribacillus frigoritolerans TaxID=450367 RepID=UPI002E1D90DA|nr:HNH endonuclease [Peribacillus frigoritolerans]